MNSASKKKCDKKNWFFTLQKIKHLIKIRIHTHSQNPGSGSAKIATLPKTEDLVRTGLVNNFPHVLNFEDRDLRTIRTGPVASYCKHKISFNTASLLEPMLRNAGHNSSYFLSCSLLGGVARRWELWGAQGRASPPSPSAYSGKHQALAEII